MFTYARKLPDVAFADRGTFTVPAVAEENIYLQLLKFSFRSAYAALDKIAEFINEHCRLGNAPRDVSFSIDLFMKEGRLRGELAAFDGLELAALVDLCDDFSKDGELTPLKELRNKLEHRCLVIIPTNLDANAHAGVGHSSAPSPTENQIAERDFYQDSLRLLRTVRWLIFYLFYFVRRTTNWPKP